MKHLYSLVALLLFFIIPLQHADAYDHVWITGTFNGWDVRNAPEMTRDENGHFVYVLALDEGHAFKISTSNPTTSHEVGSAWSKFDSGAWCLAGGSSPRPDTPLSIRQGANNINAPWPGTYTIIVDFDNATLTFSTGGEVTLPDPWSGRLPVLHIDTRSGKAIESKTDYVEATYWFDPLGHLSDDMPALGSADEPLTMLIRGRGNYTWTGFEKRPYRLKLDEKAKLAGLHSNRHFALQAHADDNRAFLRDAVGFWISKHIGMPWTPDEVPVELVLNGRYEGIYFVTENIRVAPSRVDVVEQPDYATDPFEITGGWLVEIDNYDTDPHVTVVENGGRGERIRFTYKTPEALSEQQAAYLKSQMEAIDALVYGSTQSYELWKLLDIDCLARFYITQEILDDYESFHGSCYMNRQQGYDEKWKFGPVWDFGSAYFYEKQQFIYQGRWYHQPWIAQICQFPAFIDHVKAVWREFECSHFDNLMAFIDEYTSGIGEAYEFDARRWPNYGNSGYQWRVDEVKRLLSVSRQWLIGQWGRSISGVEDVTSVEAHLEIYTAPDGLTIIAPTARCATIAGIDGRCSTVNLSEGANRISLPKGIYIVDGHKAIVR